MTFKVEGVNNINSFLREVIKCPRVDKTFKLYIDILEDKMYILNNKIMGYTIGHNMK